jgi:hypothetical protein
MKRGNTMRVTKAMKDYVRAEMDKKREALIEAHEAEYEAQRQACQDKCKEIYQAARAQISAIMENYGMDARDSWHPLNWNQYYIESKEKERENQDYRRKLSHQQDKMFTQFILECDLGINKDEFYAMVAAISFDD